MKKDDLIKFGAFLFRSGEESYKEKVGIEIHTNIVEYIETTFKDYSRKLKSEKKIKEVKMNYNEEKFN